MARASATMLMSVLISIHVVLFFAGQDGLRPQQQGGNPHQAFYTNASGGQFQDAVSKQNSTGILPDQFRITTRALGGLNVLAGVLTSPYSLFDGTRMPQFFRTLLKALLGFFEAMVVLLFIRGVAG